MTATKMSSEKAPGKQTATATPNSTSTTASRQAEIMDDRIRAYVADKAFKACFFYGHYLIFWWIIWGLMYAFDCPYRDSFSFPIAPYQIIETTMCVFSVYIPMIFATVSMMCVAATYLVIIFAGI